MLFAGWEVRIVKNCDRGLAEMWRDFQPRSHSFFTIRTDPKPANNIFIFPCGKLAEKLNCSRNFVIELAYVPPTHHRKKSNERTNE